MNIVKKAFKALVKRIFFSFGKFFCKVRLNKIVFLTFSGMYDCNPKWICEEMLRRDLPFQYFWGVLRNMDIERECYPQQVRALKRDSFAFFYHISTARVIVDNGVSTAHIGYRLKKNQYLIETWHGSLGIKRFDAETNKDQRWVKKALREAGMTDYIISNSSFENEIYRNSFWKNTEIWKYGHARNDILLNRDERVKNNLYEKIQERYHIPKGVKMCLYAPTFRDDGDVTSYTLDYARLKYSLQERFGGEWVLLVRFHWRVKALLRNFTFPDYVYNVSEYPDIQELLCVIEAGITDYSSWICEYLLTKKAGFLFAADAERYAVRDRAFFFPLTELPFPVAENEEELFENIKIFDKNKYERLCDAFLKEKGCIDDGRAAERIVTAIQKITQEEVNEQKKKRDA